MADIQNLNADATKTLTTAMPWTSASYTISFEAPMIMTFTETTINESSSVIHVI
jgi:hypothetical protein